jgi:hypothetical protein
LITSGLESIKSVSKMTLPSFVSTLKRFGPASTEGTNASNNSSVPMGEIQSFVSKPPPSKSLISRPLGHEDLANEELLRDEIVFSPESNQTSFLVDESDHELPWPLAKDNEEEVPKWEQAKLVHIKDTYRYMP